MNIDLRESRRSVTAKGLMYCGIPQNVVSVTQGDIFAEFSEVTVYEALLDYFERFNEYIRDNAWVFIKGSKQDNRDLLSGYIAKYAYARNMDVAYTTAADLFDSYYARMDARDNEDGFIERDKFEQLKNKEMLVIASVGAEMYRKSNDRVFVALLEYRSDKGLPTVLSSVKKLSELVTDKDVFDIVTYLRRKRFTIRFILSRSKVVTEDDTDA